MYQLLLGFQFAIFGTLMPPAAGKYGFAARKTDNRPLESHRLEIFYAHWKRMGSLPLRLLIMYTGLI